MLNIYKDIHSLTDFKRRTSELLDHLQRTTRPIVLTVNGRAAVVVQDAEAYQLILKRLEELETFRRCSDPAGMPGGVC
jgi:prevent-host-death family protein